MGSARTGRSQSTLDGSYQAHADNELSSSGVGRNHVLFHAIAIYVAAAGIGRHGVSSPGYSFNQ